MNTLKAGGKKKWNLQKFSKILLEVFFPNLIKDNIYGIRYIQKLEKFLLQTIEKVTVLVFFFATSFELHFKDSD